MAKSMRRPDMPQGEVWLFDAQGADLGFMPAGEALSLAKQHGLDLLRLDTRSSPPRYGLRDAAAAQAGATRAARLARGESKEIRLRVGMGAADIETQRKNAESLLAAGYRVKLRVELDPSRRRDPLPARALLDELITSLRHAGRPAAKPQAEKGAVAVTLEPV